MEQKYPLKRIARKLGILIEISKAMISKTGGYDSDKMKLTGQLL